jgi:NAD(P)-dependent dehydrogenase (short-subunit alcohol dehydrogenase family)
MDLMRLEGKNTVITGAGSGVGRASALRFAEEGARVVCADLDVDRAKQTVRLIEEAGGTAVPVGVDVSLEDDVITMLSVAIDQFGQLDIVYNNVGIPTPRLGMVFEDHTYEDFQRLIAVNLGGVFLGSKHAVLRFKEQGTGGVILNTGSVAGLVGWGGGH